MDSSGVGVGVGEGGADDLDGDGEDPASGVDEEEGLAFVEGGEGVSDEY